MFTKKNNKYLMLIRPWNILLDDNQEINFYE